MEKRVEVENIINKKESVDVINIVEKIKKTDNVIEIKNRTVGLLK